MIKKEYFETRGNFK